MNPLLVPVLVSLLLAFDSQASPDQATVVGVYSDAPNRSGHLTSDQALLILGPEHHGAYGSRARLKGGLLPVKWDYDAGTGTIAILGNLGDGLETRELEFAYDPHTATITAKDSLPQSAGIVHLTFIQKDIPPDIQKKLNDWHWDFQKAEEH